jgi:hypothetical protein
MSMAWRHPDPERAGKIVWNRRRKEQSVQVHFIFCWVMVFSGNYWRSWR